MTNQHHPVVNFAGDKVALGLLCLDLIPTHHQWHTTAGALRTLKAPLEPVSLDKFAGWYEYWTGGTDDAWFTVYEHGTQQPMGITALGDINYRHRTAEAQMTIGERTIRGKGYGTETTQLLPTLLLRHSACTV